MREEEMRGRERELVIGERKTWKPERRRETMVSIRGRGNLSGRPEAITGY